MREKNETLMAMRFERAAYYGCAFSDLGYKFSKLIAA
jgi:hypothetical protein